MKLRGESSGRMLLIPFAPGIGDMIMMEPLLRAMVGGPPDWRVTMAAREYAGDLLPPGPYDLVYPSYFVTEPPPHLKPFHRLIPQRVIAWATEPAMALDLGRFDLTINLFWIWESRTPFDEWWTPQWPRNQEVPHAVDILADYLEEELQTRIAPEERVPRIHTFPDAVDFARDYLREANPGGKRVASLVVSAANPLKWWSEARWIELNSELAGSGWRTLLVAPPDNPHARGVYEGCDPKPLWPSVDLRQLSALLQESDAVVAIDTGPLHMAAAVGAPWVGLFGATNPDLIGPYDRSKGISLVSRFPKAPSCTDCWLAFKNRESRCASLSETGCTVLIPVREVLDALEAVSSRTAVASSSTTGRSECDASGEWGGAAPSR